MLTNADFAERACYLAKSIADWAGNSLTLRERMNEPMVRRRSIVIASAVRT